MAFCRYCGKQLDEGAKFCGKCGAPVEERPMQTEMSTKRKLTWAKEKAIAFWNWKWSKAVLGALAGALLILLSVSSCSKQDNWPSGWCDYCAAYVKINSKEQCIVCGNRIADDFQENIVEPDWEEQMEEVPEEPEYEFVPDYRPGHENIYGNFNSNWANGCHIVEQDGWVYYSFWKGLYKMPVDGTEQDIVKLFDKKVNYVNVIGDWVYCSCYDYPENGTGILRIRTDGQVVEVLDTCSGSEVAVTNKYIHYTDIEQRSASSFMTVLYRMNIETLEKEVFLHEADLGQPFSLVYPIEDVLYVEFEDEYAAFVQENGELFYREKVDGIKYNRYDEKGEVNYSFNATSESAGGWEKNYYFTIRKGLDLNNDGYVDLDEMLVGKESKMIGPVGYASEDMMCFANFDKYLVISDPTYDPIHEPLDGTYLYDAETGEIKKINDDRMVYTQYAGGYLYYGTPWGDNGYPKYRCKLDGSDWSEISWMCP